MADRKISDLTALTAPAAGDYLPIVDISEVAAASKNKRITIEELFRGVPDGTAAAPGIAPESDPNTGIYSSGADQLSIATNGTERLRIDSAGQIEAVSLGTAAAPTFSFTGDPNTGIYSPGADQWAIATNGTERRRITSEGVVAYNQGAPVAVNATATLTVADLKSGIITSTTAAAAVTATLPTGTLTEGGFTSIYTNFSFEWSVINTGATNTFTVQAGTSHTLVGSGAVAANQSVRFLSRRTAANTFVTYRLS